MPGNFVISLDFEQAWGMEPARAYGAELAGIVGARAAVPAILDLAERYRIGCTWATVGMLFFGERDELISALPEVRPRYADNALSAYGRLSRLGRNEREDGLHFGRSLVERIRDCPGQEVAGHTFSHYYCLEDGEDRSAFAADLAAARVAAAARGVTLRSLVFPRNQLRPHYLAICRDAGYAVFRGNPDLPLYRARARTTEGPWLRLLRGLDSILPLMRPKEPNRPRRVGAMVDVAASRFLRPVGSMPAAAHRLHVRRIKAEMTRAARDGSTYHLWWHPQNFGRETAANLAMLGDLLEHFRRLSLEHGMRSMTMAGLAEETPYGAS